MYSSKFQLSSSFPYFFHLPHIPVDTISEHATQEEIDIFLIPDNLIPPGVEDADFEDEVNESPNLDHQDNPSIPRPPPEPPDIKKCFEPRGYGLSKITKRNDQIGANTDTGNGRAQEKPKIQSQSQKKVKLQSKVVKKSKKVNSQSTTVNHGSTKSTH
ncbi:hypothetical protein Tco_1456190 [Tanacetum coccineum]